MSVCRGTPAWHGTTWDGTGVHHARCAAGAWGGLWGHVREANEPLPAGKKGVDTAGDAVAVNARFPWGLCHGS
jgi:hypothetical protein